MHRWDGPSSFPYVITLFSAPNYCDYYSNKASVLILENGNVSIKQYDQVDHPYHLPDQIDVFTWSMPFVADKVVSLLTHVLKKTRGEEYDGDGAIKAIGDDVVKKRKAMMGKIKTVARMQKMFSTLKNESESLLKIKGMAPDGKIPRGLLLEGRPAIRDALREFERAKELDRVNERRPVKG